MNKNSELSLSPINNFEDQLDKYKKKEKNIKYIKISEHSENYKKNSKNLEDIEKSITDFSTDAPRLLARNINYKNYSITNNIENNMIRGSRKLVVPKNKYSIREGSMERNERTVEDNTPTEVDVSEVVDTENLEERRGERRDKRRGRRSDSKERRARKEESERIMSLSQERPEAGKKKKGSKKGKKLSEESSLPDLSSPATATIASHASQNTYVKNMVKNNHLVLSDNTQNKIFGSLPSDYSGMVPEHLQMNLPHGFNNMGNMGMGNMGMGEMNMDMSSMNAMGMNPMNMAMGQPQMGQPQFNELANTLGGVPQSNPMLGSAMAGDMGMSMNPSLGSAMMGSQNALPLTDNPAVQNMMGQQLAQQASMNNMVEMPQMQQMVPQGAMPMQQGGSLNPNKYQVYKIDMGFFF